jgi:general secretion pathway protein G
MNKYKGFTLLEIMVVIVILGLLAGLVVPNVMGSVDQANVQKVVTDINGIETALKQYKMDVGRYPTTDQGLQALVEKPSSAPIPKKYRSDGYLEKLSQDPWHSDYYYKMPSDHGKKYDIFSAGLDGEVGTCDDIGNWNVDNPPSQDDCNNQ